MSPHHGYVVVHVLEKHALVAQRYAGVGESFQPFLNFGCQFLRVVGMDAYEEGMESVQNFAELGCDPLREENRDSGSYAEEFNMRNGAEFTEQVFEFVVGQQQRIAAAEEDVPDFAMVADVLKLFFEIGMKIVTGGVTDQSGAGAVSTIRSATIGDQEEDPVGVSVD